MKTFTIPVSYMMYGTYEIEADSFEEAKEKILDSNTPLPDNASYLEDSLEVDEDVYHEIYEQETV